MKVFLSPCSSFKMAHLLKSYLPHEYLIFSQYTELPLLCWVSHRFKSSPQTLSECLCSEHREWTKHRCSLPGNDHNVKITATRVRSIVAWPESHLNNWWYCWHWNLSCYILGKTSNPNTAFSFFPCPLSLAGRCPTTKEQNIGKGSQGPRAFSIQTLLCALSQSTRYK